MKFNIIILFFIITLHAFSQSTNTSVPPINWQLLDWQKDGYPGMSVEKAYNKLLIHKKPLKKIIVAIIDDGLDATHPDLIGMEWTNAKEIAGNGVDDDKNGYIDDIHGWNFVGNNRKETFEEIREYVRLRGQFENKDSLSLKTDPQYGYWRTIVAAKNNQLNTLQGNAVMVARIISAFQALQNYWSKRLSTDSVSFAHIIQDQYSYAGADSMVTLARTFILSFKDNAKETPYSTSIIAVMRSIKPYADEAAKALSIADTIIEKNDPGYFRKEYLNDDPYSNLSKGYGNGNIFPDDIHGTECAGIIAALRHNHIGGNGITNSVAIMPLRINAMGHLSDEWDKDVANAIRYAADNGAQVISMSFGKYYSPQQQWVRDAIVYAAKKGVLLVHAAMNDAINIDSMISYPQEYYNDGEQAKNLINVGASTYDSSLVGDFSNYGAHTVDVFAPGVAIYMPVLHGGYQRGFGTSFACPMVAGLAALIWSYYPKLTYLQVRECIEKSATPINQTVTKPGTSEKVQFRTLSRTGGIVNAYKALQEAEQIAKKGH